MVYEKNLTVERLTFFPFYDITVSNTATVYGALFWRLHEEITFVFYKV